MLTRQEEILVADLKQVGADMDLIKTVMSFIKTEKLQAQMDDFIVKRYQSKGEVTEQDILKAVIILTAKRKQS